MSIKKWTTTFLLLFSFSLMIYIYYTDNKKPPHSSRTVLQSKFSSKGVANRIIQVRLNSDEKQSNTEKVEISAEVSTPFDFTDKLYFKWQLGQDVILVSGELAGEIHSLLKNEPKKIYLTVTGFSKENNHHVRFEISGTKNGKSIYGDALIASDLENTFENTVQNVEKIKASQ
ncbi:MAG: hypothetical protein AABY53_05230 [Bdellovibrionota bacterium]